MDVPDGQIPIGICSTKFLPGKICIIKENHNPSHPPTPPRKNPDPAGQNRKKLLQHVEEGVELVTHDAVVDDGRQSRLLPSQAVEIQCQTLKQALVTELQQPIPERVI